MYIEGIGDEVTNFFIILLAFVITYFGWQSTRVRESSTVGVLIVENNRRQLSNTISELAEAVRSESQMSNRTETEELEVVNNVIEELENDISDFMNNGESEETEQGAEESIIQRMDQPDEVRAPEKEPQCEMRQRKPDVKDTEKEMTIKLKYLNDDMRMVTAKSSEAIGDFKKRNFTVELAAQKLVRLVFNGHVLQPDKKTLLECGLFDNCVVHCLIHNRKQSSPTTANQANQQDSTGNPDANNTGGIGQQTAGRENETFLNRPEHGRWYLYIGMIFISLTLLFCWFCRVQYAYLFSFYSTVGLILMSVLFIAMIPLIILIERDVVG